MAIVDIGLLLNKQQDLDSFISSNQKENNQPIKWSSKLNKIALLVELSEMANEFKTFKWWSSSEKKLEDVYEKALEEYVDVLHFALSTALFYKTKKTDYSLKKLQSLNYIKYVNDSIFTLYETALAINDLNSAQAFLNQLLNFGFNIFSFPTILEAYLKKNEINFLRQKQAY